MRALTCTQIEKPQSAPEDSERPLKPLAQETIICLTESEVSNRPTETPIFEALQLELFLPLHFEGKAESHQA